MKRHVAVLAMLFGLMQMPAQAADWYADIAYADGGDEFNVYVEDDDGDLSTESVSLGGGFSGSLGGINYFTETFSFQYSLGYKEDSVTAGSDSVKFSRFPLDLVGSFDLGDVFQVGVGISHEFNPKLDLSDAGMGSHSFDDATGEILQIGFRFTSWKLLIRQTMMDYSYEGLDFDGDNVSIRAAFIF
ncbi:hypothetical protein HPT27_11030 [Permianibacter sp. IMCC34836]|uniref:hypothetical protein n=1 Tax=Permianibacter fluminis TaxID=2738515 RepID=UPI001552BC63|nr:hypothetical protein [Permianibacter fluminis]NQD37560.1 hypothetical protein [Permianibacter fluminis]